MFRIPALVSVPLHHIKLCYSDYDTPRFGLFLPFSFAEPSRLSPCVGDGGHCARWDLQVQKPFPRSVLGGLQTVPLTSWFVVGPALSDRDRCEPFHIVSNQLNLAPVDSNRIVETLETGRSWRHGLEDQQVTNQLSPSLSLSLFLPLALSLAAAELIAGSRPRPTPLEEETPH